MTKLETLVVNALGDTYKPKAREYVVLTPDKAVARVAHKGWTHEKDVTRRHANGNDEYLVILSKPLPAPPPKPTPTPTHTPVVEKVKEIIHGNRKSR